MLYVTNLLSNIFYIISHTHFPKWFQTPINWSYAKLFKIDFSEFEPLSSYKSLSELFIRKLKKVRKLQDGFISPADGMVFDLGRCDELGYFEIKKRGYLFSELSPFRFSPKSFINIYLSPSNYHRFHAPVDCKLIEKIEISGPLLPVNNFFMGLFSKIYAKNKRVALLFEMQNSERFVFVAIGALNVGKIIIENKSEFKKGDELGYFDMGSSILLFFEKEVNFYHKKELKIGFGEALF